uniref:Protein sidekick-1 n=1 Tax=Sphaerodactylus townsendi TaxID=933632 RepID=A0ACB8FKW0_9SAUR
MVTPSRVSRRGYQISWEVYGRNASRLARALTNTTLEYKITGLSSLTTYTIEVAAMTAKGTGAVTSSTISSGVPPELPGMPSNLVISNISPRSATLQFRPGYDGKTSVSKWIVEGQVLIKGGVTEIAHLRSQQQLLCSDGKINHPRHLAKLSESTQRQPQNLKCSLL